MDKQKQVEEIEITQKAIRKSADGEGAFVDLLNQEMKELQDSQKQIEEMVKDLVSEMLLPQYVEEVLKQPFSYFEEHYKDEIKSCFYLRKKGYRKIPENAVVLTREEYENLNLKLFEYEVSISRDYVQQDIFDEVLDEKIDIEIENYILHDRVKALEELVGALKRQIEAYKEQVEALKEFNDVSCKKTRKETVEKFKALLEGTVPQGLLDEIAKEITEGE